MTATEISIVEESSPGEIGEVNINTASASELAMLDGVGPKTADLIISGRPYRTVEGLLKVRDIGKKTLAKFCKKVVL